MGNSGGLLGGKVALVTGAGEGIGKAIALAFAAHGAAVLVAEIRPETAARTAEEIAAGGGRALAVATDVREASAVDRAVAAAVEAFGGLDVLVNNVGGTFARPFLEIEEKGWDALLRTNLKSVFHGTRSASPAIAARGGGSILNVVSIEGVRAAPMFAPYAACKAAVVNFTQTMALELAPQGIRVNAIAPDVCLTEGVLRQMPEAALRRQACRVPLGRIAEPAEIAGPAVFLASSLASYVTGVTLHVDGGTHAAGGWYRDPAGADWVLGPGREPDPAGPAAKSEGARRF
jgi:NAD(P)-dependent dehydrogenase (short-subunit alcohol dehydrogenase family)